MKQHTVEIHPSECYICLKKIESDFVSLQCNHRYHKSCMYDLLFNQIYESSDPFVEIRCPICFKIACIVNHSNNHNFTGNSPEQVTKQFNRIHKIIKYINILTCISWFIIFIFVML